ncbi:MAG: hypothetical protein AVDCRST_MAG88-2125, partial [uncultured Thermomicrobiales bacterium]
SCLRTFSGGSSRSSPRRWGYGARGAPSAKRRP